MSRIFWAVAAIAAAALAVSLLFPPLEAVGEPGSAAVGGGAVARERDSAA
jgi:hypothetical protein